MDFSYVGKEMTTTCGCGGGKKEQIECDVYFVKVDNIGIKLYYNGNDRIREELLRYRVINKVVNYEQVTAINTLTLLQLERLLDKYSLKLPR